MIELVTSVQSKNLDGHLSPSIISRSHSCVHHLGFESVLRIHKEAIVGDKFINGYIPSLRRELQKRVFVELSRPYTNLRLGFVGKVYFSSLSLPLSLSCLWSHIHSVFI